MGIVPEGGHGGQSFRFHSCQLAGLMEKQKTIGAGVRQASDLPRMATFVLSMACRTGKRRTSCVTRGSFRGVLPTKTSI